MDHEGNSRFVILKLGALVASVLLLADVAQAAPVDYEIPEAAKAAAVRQPSSWTGWAAAATTMRSWNKRDAYDIPTVLKAVGGSYLALFINNKALPVADKPAFLQAMELKVEAPQNRTVAGWESLLRKHGALWVTTADAARDMPYFSLRARIVTKVVGDGTMTGTLLMSLDPADGEAHVESVAAFLKAFEEVARRQFGESAELRPQIVRY